MPTLLCSVGTSWAVVPEAMQLLGPCGFHAVHVLTTSSPRLDPGLAELGEYIRWNPVRASSISRVAGFAELLDERDHARFEEVLYRWVVHMAPDPSSRYVCLAGGYKTMSAAMQKAAAVLGAAEVFHVLCEPRFGDGGDREPATRGEVEQAIAEGAVRFVRLGPESGWPQLADVRPDSFPLLITGDGPVRIVDATDARFRDRVREIVERSHRIAGAWEQLASLPFVSLATWPRARLDWLEEPLDPATDGAWVRSLPKVELHCHLGGFATGGELLRSVRAATTAPEQLPPLAQPELPPGWPRPSQPIRLDAYMHLGDATGSTLLRDPGCLAAQCHLLYQALVDDHVVYAEIRCSPANYQDPFRGRSSWDVLSDIRAVFQRAMDETPAERRCHVNLLLIATRQESRDRSPIARHLALAITAAEHWRGGCRVVGVDLAGFEHRETRAAMFATDFEAAHRVGLAVTVHAGENDDVEGIWQAVFKLSARRLGHALHLGQAPDLLRVVAERGIGVEMCPYANLQIKGYFPTGTGERYPLGEYLRAGVPVTVNSDNLGISAATLSDNLLLAGELCPGLRRVDVLRLQANAAEVAFLSPGERRVLRARLGAVEMP